VTAQGHPRAIFSRAVERGDLVVAEATAREVGKLNLEEALKLVFLYAEKDQIKFERAALRWLARYITEGASWRRFPASSSSPALASSKLKRRERELRFQQRDRRSPI
jgi:hypothetical protein